MLALAALWPQAAALSAPPAVETFETKLGLTPSPDGVKPKISGTGFASASLKGTVLTLECRFSGLNGSVTDAHLMSGSGIGIPGTILSATSLMPTGPGAITGSVKLSRPQIAALRAGRVYVQLNSDKSPAPAGHLWGWLLPTHEKVEQDESQSGSWYLPQGAGLKSHARNQKS